VAANDLKNIPSHSCISVLTIITITALFLSISAPAVTSPGTTPASTAGINLGLAGARPSEYPRPKRIIYLPALSAASITDLTHQSKTDRARALQIGLQRTLDSPIVVSPAAIAPRDWTVNPDGSRALTFQVLSSGARGVRLHFENITSPPGARILIYNVATPSVSPLLIDSTSLAGVSDLWTGTIFAEHIGLDIQVPAGTDPSQVSFRVAELSHIFRAPTLPDHLKEGTCENDATCYPDYAQQENAVALYTYVQNGNTFMCTGCLLDTAQKRVASTNYFLTARHCISSQSQASTLEFYWLFQTAECNGEPPLVTSVPKTTGGAELLAVGVSDFSFLRLRAAPPAGVTRAQWTVTPPDSSEILGCIHHPDGKFKRASFGVYLGSNPYFLAIQWASGVTEPGSSGAPLFNASHQLVGQLTGGFDGPGSSCDNPSALDQFGRFDVTYPYIKKWIDPDGLDGGPPPVNGTYYSLFYAESTGGTPGSSGSVTITTTAKGSFTGKVQMGARMYPFSGDLNANGVGNAIVKRRGLSPLTLKFQINLGEGADALTGLVTDGDWTDYLSGDRAVFSKTNTCPQAGRYTVLIPATDGAGPAGNSYGTVQVDALGRLTFIGVLADGTKVTQSTYVSRTGRWPLYIPAYRGQGSLFSWASLAPGDSGDVTGRLTWVRPDPNGFQVVSALNGSLYEYTPRTGSVLNFSNAVLTVMGGSLAQPVQADVTVKPNGTVVSAKHSGIKLKFFPTTGLFLGSAVDQAAKQRLRLGGVALQKQNMASGFFIEGPQTGQVGLQPAGF
jgi:lysyl endopeptidase